MIRLTRRRMMQGTAAGALAATTPLGLRAQEPKRGGRFRVAMEHGSTSDTLDPAVLENAFAQAFAYARNGYLTEIAPDNTLAPSLARQWETNEDASEWIFDLIEGATFHNGKEVTAEDVVASLRYHMGEESTSAAKPIVEPIADMRADGKYRVIVTMKSGNADFPYVLSDYHLAILPSQDGKIEVTPVGAGAYEVVSYEPGVRAELRRRDDHWKDDVAWFDEAEMLTIVDPTARQNALLTGEVDAIDAVDLNTVHLLERRPNVVVLSVTGTQHYTFAMDTRVDPFTDNNIRLALKHAVDREELVEKILNGYGSVGNDHPIGPQQRFFAEDLEQRTYDPDRARHYLKQAGLDRLDVSLSAADAAFAGAVDAAVLYSEAAAKAGININIVREPNDGYWSNVWMVKPFSAVYWGGRPTADWMFSTAYSAGAAWNDTFWQHERFNELLLAARSQTDEEKRAEIYAEMQQIVRDEGGVVIPMFADYVGAHTDRVQHGENVAANWAMDGLRMIERWWFA